MNTQTNLEMLNDIPEALGVELRKGFREGLYNLYVLMSDLTEYALLVDLELPDALELLDIYSRVFANNPSLC